MHTVVPPLLEMPVIPRKYGMQGCTSREDTASRFAPSGPRGKRIRKQQETQPRQGPQAGRGVRCREVSLAAWRAGEHLRASLWARVTRRTTDSSRPSRHLADGGDSGETKKAKRRPAISQARKRVGG